MNFTTLPARYGELLTVRFDDGTIAAITPMTYDRARLHVDDPNSSGCYRDTW